MRQKILKFTFAAAFAGACSLPLAAAPLQRTDVAATSAWVLHLDLDALRPTVIGQHILSEADKPEAKAKLAIFQTLFNFDLRTQLHGVTLYGSSPAPEDGVLVLYADFDPARLVTLAQAAKDYQSSPHGQNVIHNWIDDKKKPKDGVKPRVFAAIQGNRVIFGQRGETVARALEVVEGSLQNLSSGTNFSELGVAGNGHFIEAAALKMKLPDGDPNAAILKMSKSVQIVLGESAQQLNGRLTLVADNEEVAGSVQSIMQGLLSLARLQTDKPESVQVANAITLAQDGSRVAGNLILPATEVVKMMKADAARKAAAKSSKESSKE